MEIIYKSQEIPIKFNSIVPGDCFKLQTYKHSSLYLKIEPVDKFNALDLKTNTMVYICENQIVIPLNCEIVEK